MNSALHPPQTTDPISGDKPLLIFSHGNSFPAGTYRQLHEVWRRAGYQVECVERFGHDPRHPVTSNWPHLVEELTEFIQAHATGPAWLVGHSLGGLLSLMVAARHPALARGVVMLDSPFISGWRAHSVHMLKASRLIHKVSPARFASRRRQRWNSRDEVRQHFSSKANFARWDPAVLEDYVQAGFVEDAEGVRLAFDRAIEARIYNGLPHNLDRWLARHPLRCPVGFIAGTQSVEVRQGGLAASRRLARHHFRWIEGTHLYPMERPEETATAVLQLLDELAADPRGRLL